MDQSACRTAALHSPKISQDSTGPRAGRRLLKKGNSDMIDLLEELERDHLNMAALLRVLERQVEVFRRGQAPDYEIIQAVMEYFLDYPDLIHHPKEDILGRRLMAKGGAAASVLTSTPSLAS